MTYIVKQKIHGKDYYYLRKAVRKGDKVTSKYVAYLGKTKKEAEKKAKEILKVRKTGNFSHHSNQENLKIQKSRKFLSHSNQEDLKEKNKKQERKGINMEMNLQHKNISVDEIAAFCKRKGFVYPSGEIYGGLSGMWDFGHLGVELKNNLKREWWKFHVYNRDDIVGIDGAIITNPKVWEASGHVNAFVDVAVLNKKTKEKFKIDKHEIAKYQNDNNYEIKGEFNPMFTTQVGPVAEDSVKAYLRPETAQLIFADFKLVFENSRMKLPAGIAQVGKAFRNEIAPRDFLFRCREFEQMEIEYFVNPKGKCIYEIPNIDILVYSSEMQKQGEEMERMKFSDAFKKRIIKTEWHAYWLCQEFLWFVSLGANPLKFRIRQHMQDEKSHYALDTWDLEYEFPFGWKELLGMANRSDFDLKQHQEHSGKDMSILDEKTGEKFIPHVVCEPSLGVERAFLVFMFDAYNYDKSRDNIVLRLNPKLSPIKAAVFPIVKRDDMEKIADDIVDELKREFNVVHDRSGSLGRRYSRSDEVGIPITITVDGDTIKDKTVTLRDRDTTEQIRVKISEIKDILDKVIGGRNLLTFGKRVNTRVK